ncbi:unnamed protein product, partial [Meganyctiphanes norvegica]
APQPDDAVNPCDGSHCGPNSRCQATGKTFNCYCLPGFTGLPPNCTCIGDKCRVPAPPAAPADTSDSLIPEPKSHAPANPVPDSPHVHPDSTNYYCYPPNCELASSEEVPVTVLPDGVDPCDANLCGPYAICASQVGAFNCTCAPGYFGFPPKCQPECVSHDDCPETLACDDRRCHDPCTGNYGDNAVCQVKNHIPKCSCTQLLTGDPHISCNPQGTATGRSEEEHTEEFIEGTDYTTEIAGVTIVFPIEENDYTTEIAGVPIVFPVEGTDYTTEIAGIPIVFPVEDTEYTTEIADIPINLPVEDTEYTTEIADIPINVPIEGNNSIVVTTSPEE